MRLRLATPVILLAAILGATPAAAEQVAPREIWPQATSAVREGDLDNAGRKTTELLTTGRAYGLKRYPAYAAASAAFARQADKDAKPDVSAWALKAAAQLDARSPAVDFALADRSALLSNWGAAIPAAIRGMTHLLAGYRTRALTRADMVIVAACAVALTAIIFAVTLFIRYGRSMAHDFREILGTRLRGGAVSVLAFALLFLPIFLWLGPMWLVLYWFVIFFSYANIRERILVVVIALLLSALPVLTDLAASWISVVESPAVVSAISSLEQSYQPEAVRRMQELVAIVPDNPTLQILLGNMQVYEGNEAVAAEHYRRAIQISDPAGAHVNLGNLHFLQNDYAAAITEYGQAQARDPKMAIAFYNDSVASGETYRFDQQGKKLEQAKKLDRDYISQVSEERSAQKVVMYHPQIAEAWTVSSAIAKRGVARSLFGNYSWFDPIGSALNPITVGSIVSVLLAVGLWFFRRRTGLAGSCIKCGRTFCHRCKSSRESATYCTQCIHIYLKRDGVALATKRAKLDEVSNFHSGMQRRNRLFATFLPGSAQLLEGRTGTGLLGVFLFFFFVATALLVGRLAPALGPVADTAQLMVRSGAILLAVIIWFVLSLPVYRRRAVA